ncbi:polysaccharide biosynthesis/export family protein [Mucilaginibacter litoreus]|uniref:Polysaccharide biosynthesis/export family protein n=1 Tax=Mucilaginibacter litoreus TaxID=1048221 RepID=A0ABW3AMP4_9SPHI
MKRTLLFQAVVLMVWLSSCSSYKNVPYFQDVKRSPVPQEDITNFSPLIVQPQDVLSVHVTSLNASAWQDSTNKAEYIVSEQGNIQLPLLGQVQVAGSTATELQTKFTEELKRFLKSPTVNVKILNFKIAVLGDVMRPDVFKINNTRVTVLEALSLAGDLNITARRTDVLLIREVNGKRSYINIDLTSAKLFQADTYYLKNNDVLYVKPDKTKFAEVDRGYRTLSLILSGLSIVAIVLANVLK